MSKNIIIQEGGTGKQLTVDKLETNVVGGGTCPWVPEDGTVLGAITITENGTRRAVDDGYYGYSEVTVNSVGSATGLDDDGDYRTVSVDPSTGRLVSIKIPSNIVITTPPTLTSYSDGDAIDFSGMVVKAYLETGGLWTDATHPDGIIPISELSLPVASADAEKAYGGMWSDGHGVNAAMFVYTQHWDTDWRGQDFAVYVDMTQVAAYRNSDHAPEYLGSRKIAGGGPAIVLATIYENNIYHYRISGDTGDFYLYRYDPSKEHYKYIDAITGGTSTVLNTWTKYGSFSSRTVTFPVSTADPMRAGEMSPVDPFQVIPVQWVRPGDKATLSTSFDITIV